MWRHVETYVTSTSRTNTSPEHFGCISRRTARARDRLLLQLDRFLKKQSSKSRKPHSQPWISRFQWALGRNKINRVRMEFRDVGLNLVVELTITSSNTISLAFPSSQQFGNRVVVDKVFLATAQLQRDQRLASTSDRATSRKAPTQPSSRFRY